MGEKFLSLIKFQSLLRSSNNDVPQFNSDYTLGMRSHQNLTEGKITPEQLATHHSPIKTVTCEPQKDNLRTKSISDQDQITVFDINESNSNGSGGVVAGSQDTKPQQQQQQLLLHPMKQVNSSSSNNLDYPREQFYHHDEMYCFSSQSHYSNSSRLHTIYELQNQEESRSSNSAVFIKRQFKQPMNEGSSLRECEGEQSASIQLHSS